MTTSRWQRLCVLAQEFMAVGMHHKSSSSSSFIGSQTNGAAQTNFRKMTV